ncbi:hypothetical protein T459_12138 [Capsicum annuum]|uniref:Uncharacterized protein n=1 Tax=Capsicum annuum TaxID=4072 RepID=A0A2G2ZP18_CAPAN|nr:hypothetical protein FXO37_18909 [Capsicum annuum]PHT83695.1 hypothetical protein T459_12138 [Capsicum annuum]
MPWVRTSAESPSSGRYSERKWWYPPQAGGSSHQPLNDRFNMGVDENVVYKDYDKYVQVLLKHMEPSFLYMNDTGVPHRHTLGWMNPLSRRSFNCSFNFLSFDGAILYSGIDMGLVSWIRSILKSIFLSRGTPEMSSGNTSGNSHAIDPDQRVGVFEIDPGLERDGRHIS